MRKLYILLILALVIGLASEAQPDYYNHATTTGGANLFPFGTNPTWPNGKKVQWIITPTGSSGGFNLPGPTPAGNNITTLWFWANGAGNATYTNLLVRLGTVSTSTFFTIGAWYTGPMTTVRSQTTTLVSAGANTWVGIPLTTSFLYDPSMNLVVEVSHCGYTGTGFNLRQLAFGAAPNYRRQYSDASSACGVTVLATGGDLNVAGIGVTLVPAVPCPPPAAQPTGLNLTAISQVQINGSFTAAVPPPTNYLVVRYPFGASPVNPVNGVTYNVGGPLGTGTIVSTSNSTSFTATGLAPATTYDFYVYSYNSGACGNNYLTSSPLFGTMTTLPCAGPPGITCPANITTSNTPGLCGATVNYPAATGSGSPPPTITYSIPSGSFFPIGTTTITATATSICGTATCTFTITVADNQPPIITCPANITRNNDPGLCSAVVNYTLPTVRDNCDPPPLQFPPSFAAHGGGTVFSLSGNTLPGGLFFTLTNNTGSSRTVNSFGVRFGDPAFGLVTAPQTLTIWSRPGGLTTAIENSTAGWTQQGPQVVNPIPPYFPTGTGPLGICGMNTPVTIANGASASFFIHGQTACPIFNYNFGISPPVTNAGVTLTGGTISFDVLGSANHFNQGSVNGIINIQANFAGPIVPVLIGGLASGSAFPVGTTTNTYRATDPAGNTATCSFTVTVADVEQPTITCPVNITRNTDPNVCTATIAVPNPTNLTDNCGVTQLTWVMSGATSGSALGPGINYVGTKTFNLNGTTGQGVTTIVYTARDAAGNTRTCSFTVTVNDLVLPNISQHPQTKFVCVGSPGVFSVTATANGGPIAYQWQEWNGTAWANIAGATANSFTVPSVAFTDNTRSFRVILTGLCSVVTSNAATLYVNPLPTITLISSIPPSLLPGQSLTITATGNPAGGTFEWFKNNVLTGHSGSTWSGLTVDDIGTYKVRYTDLNGCVSTSADLTITGQPSKNLYVYPNPNTGHFQVRIYNQPNESITLRVYDSKGAKVFEKVEVTGTAYTGIDVDLSPVISSGVYTVEVRDGSGKSVGARRIVVRHP